MTEPLGIFINKEILENFIEKLKQSPESDTEEIKEVIEGLQRYLNEKYGYPDNSE